MTLLVARRASLAGALAVPPPPFDPIERVEWEAVYWTEGAWTPPNDGDPVSQWDDQSGNGNHLVQATAANQPTYLASGNAGRPAIRFDAGGPSYLDAAGVSQSQPNTVVVVWRKGGTGTEMAHDGISARQFHSASGTWNYFAGSVRSSSSPFAPDISDVRLAVLRFDGSGSTMNIDGQLSSDLNPGTQALDGLRVGANNFESQGVDQGEIMFVGVRAGVMSAGEEADLTDWVESYYRPAPISPGVFDPLADVPWTSAWWAEDPNWTDPGDGNPVPQWDAGVGTHDLVEAASASQPPTYRAAVTQMGGQPAIDFATGDWMEATGLAQSQPNTIVFVFRAKDTSDRALCDGLSSRQFIRSGTNYQWFAGSSRTGGTGDTDNPHILVANFTTQTGSRALEVDGVAVNTQSPGSNSLNGFTVGALLDGALWQMNGWIAFVGIADHILSRGHRDNLLAWAQDHYGVPS